MAASDQLYRISPVWTQDALVSAKGWLNETRRIDRAVAQKHYQLLLESQYWSESDLAAFQLSELRSLLDYSFKSVPYYRELSNRLNMRAQDFKSLDDLSNLPTLSKQQVRGNERQFIADEFAQKRLLRAFTSGTTGTPLSLYSRPEFFARRWAFELRLRNWAGLENPEKPRRAQFTGQTICAPTEKSRFWRRNIPGNSLLLSTIHISKTTAEAYATALMDFAPDFIDGYPSAISLLARICREHDYALPRVRAIRVSAETLFPEDMKVIEDAFQGKVFNQYGASESACFCSFNKHQEMVVHPEFGILEVLDSAGRKSAYNECGTVVTTAFVNRAMPLVRYELGDSISLSSSKPSCPEGAGFQRVNEVQGRNDDSIAIPGVGEVGRMDTIFKGLTGIVEAQIVRHEPDRMVVYVAKDGNWNSESHRRLLSKLRAKVGAEIRLDIELVDSIKRGPNGKFRAVVDLTRRAAGD